MNAAEGNRKLDALQLWRQQLTGDARCWRGGSDELGYGLPPTIQGVPSIQGVPAIVAVLTRFRTVISPTAGGFALGFLRLCTKIQLQTNNLCSSAPKLRADCCCRAVVVKSSPKSVRVGDPRAVLWSRWFALASSVCLRTVSCLRLLVQSWGLRTGCWPVPWCPVGELSPLFPVLRCRTW